VQLRELEVPTEQNVRQTMNQRRVELRGGLLPKLHGLEQPQHLEQYEKQDEDEKDVGHVVILRRH
jgi:hypothetical protein